jgi:hypothetical protein
MYILLESDSFEECYRSSNYGGSVWVNNNNAYFVIVNSKSYKSRISTSSSSSYYGAFLYSYINSAKNYNFVLYTTVSDSYQDTSTNNIWGTIYLYRGQIRVISTNNSNNNIYKYSSFWLTAISNSDYSSQLNYSTQDSYLHYCYIMNNYAYYYICIYFNSNKHTCEESNIINNSECYDGCGILANYGSAVTTINQCCFIHNNDYGSGTRLFYADSGSTIEVKESTLQNTKCGTNGAVTTISRNNKEGDVCSDITNVGPILDDDIDDDSEKTSRNS